MRERGIRISNPLRTWLVVAVLASLFVAGGCGVRRDSRGFAIIRTSPGMGPKGSPWTIRCLEIHSLDTQSQMPAIAESLKRTPGIRPSDVIVLEGDDGVSRLYYGTYYRTTDVATGKRSISNRLQNDMAMIKELATDTGQHLFMLSSIVRVPLRNWGTPEWALTGVTGAFSLQVAVFEPTDEFWDFKLAAFEYCSELRKRGYEAYYHHTDAASMVTVGVFDESDAPVGHSGLREFRRYSAKVMALRRDPLLQYNRLNGRIYSTVSDKGVRIPMESRLVGIPGVGLIEDWLR